LHAWLELAEEHLVKEKNLIFHSSLSEHNRLSQLNVLQQLEHLSSYAFIQDRLQTRALRLHGWWFDIAEAAVYCYERAMKQFVLIDEQEAQQILARL
jgi:carbonic anhydrase